MKNLRKILIVDDDRDILDAGQLLLKRRFDRVVTCEDPDQIPSLMAEQTFDAILLDMNFSPGERSGEKGLYWLGRILETDPDAVVVMITAHGNVATAVEAMKHGATDFIAKPWQNEKVVATLSSAVSLHQSRTETARLRQSNQGLAQALDTTQGSSSQQLLGSSDAMQLVQSMIRRSAPTDANVLIIGENGTGKELVARELHRQSLRSDEIFMSIDLGSISESLFESELFGHRRGAFTGADRDRVGRLVAANGGTLFLDEIANIPLHLQSKLLTVLEQRQVTPLGSNEATDIDVRVIAATNVTRATLNDEQRFRQDLLFRLNTVEIALPPLRDRPGDVLEIAVYYARLYAQKYRKREKPFSRQALDAARRWHWPGNVRALRHAIERAVILSEGDEYEIEDLQIPNVNGIDSVAAVSSQSHSVSKVLSPPPTEIDDLNLKSMEKRLITAALNKYNNNISRAASVLGLTRATLYRRIKSYGL